MNAKVFVVLPAFNEVDSLRELVPQAASQLVGRAFEICVVDDGSTDATAELLRQLSDAIPVKYLRHALNQGYGAALRTGFEYACHSGGAEDIAISLDADRTQSPTYFPALIKKIEDGNDIATASYALPNGGATGLPLRRRIMSRVVNALFALRCHIPGTRLYTNGYRAYRLGSLQRAFQRAEPFAQNGFAGGTELFLRAASFPGIKTAEIAFVLHYEKRGSQSRIRILETIRGYLSVLFHYKGVAVGQ